MHLRDIFIDHKDLVRPTVSLHNFVVIHVSFTLSVYSCFIVLFNLIIFSKNVRKLNGKPWRMKGNEIENLRFNNIHSFLF